MNGNYKGTEHYTLTKTENGWHGDPDDCDWQWFDFPDLTFTDDGEWYINLQGVDGNLMQEAEVVEDVYGENEEEWETVANKLLAEYGLKLGDFDEKAGDRYTLVEA